MGHLTWILLCSTLYILHSHSYVLLTANVEDVQSIAHQVANSPLLNQIKDVWRRASRTFQKNLNNPKMRADDDGEDQDTGNSRGDADDQADNRDEKPEDQPSDYRVQRREAVEQLMNLGRNASVYLGNIKKIIDKI